MSLSSASWIVLSVCIAFYLAAFSLYHFMIIRANKGLPVDQRIPHSLSFGEKKRIAEEYKAFYPRSFLYELTLGCAITLLSLALVFAVLRTWIAVGVL
jgi:hypothetical protein